MQTLTNPVSQTKVWNLKGREAKVVGSHSGQVDWWFIKIQWSSKLGLTYYQSFHGAMKISPEGILDSDPELYRKAKEIADYINQKGYIHPDMLHDGEKVWDKVFYPGEGFTQTHSD